MTKSILLTRGRYARVDDADFPALTKHRWMYSTKGYAIRAYKNDQDCWRFIHMHRVIMDAEPGQLVDHIDGDRLNNSRANLRFVTPSQNAWNAKKRCDNSTGFKGVSEHPNGYLARIRYLRQRIHLGYFDNPRDAALMYDAAAATLFGEYAKINLPDEDTPPHVAAQLDKVLTRWAHKIQSHP